VSIDPINDLCPDVLLIPITSHAGPLRVALPDEPMRTGLRIASFAKCESLGPIHKSRLRKRIGAIPSGAWLELEIGMKRVLGLE
jgi:mRNA-degrading endonuclease toxin of MazEF toxin-antitoxin module